MATVQHDPLRAHVFIDSELEGGTVNPRTHGLNGQTYNESENLIAHLCRCENKQMISTSSSI